MSNLDHFSAVTVTSSPAKSLPSSSPSRVSQEEISVDPEAPSLHIPPPQLLLALSELEFNKVFLLLTYIPGKDLGWKDLSMVAFEAAVWERILVPQQTVDCHSNGIVARVISVMSLLTAVTHSRLIPLFNSYLWALFLSLLEHTCTRSWVMIMF
ncbi:unnamed protein product [Brassica oleracea]